MKIFSPESSGSFTARLDPRARVLGSLVVVFAVVGMDRWSALGAALLAALALVVAARAANLWTLRRLAGVNLFGLFLLASMPLGIAPDGGWTWGGDGVVAALRIVLKANAVMLFCGVLLGGMEPADLAHALARMGVPAPLAQTLFFCIRYLDVVHYEYHRLRHAMKLRAFRPTCGLHSLRGFGYLLGMLLVRSMDRSDRILEAMKCRGFRGRLYSLAEFRYGRGDTLFVAAAIALVLALGILEWRTWTP